MSVKLETKQEFNIHVGQVEAQKNYKKPIGFGICRLYRRQLNRNKILQVTFPVVNWRENYRSAAVFIDALQESGEIIDFSASEQVFELNSQFIDVCMKSFNPFLHEAYGDKHKNIQVVLQLLKFNAEFIKNGFKIVFIFEDTIVKSVEAVYLKLCALLLKKKLSLEV